RNAPARPATVLAAWTISARDSSSAAEDGSQRHGKRARSRTRPSRRSTLAERRACCAVRRALSSFNRIRQRTALTERLSAVKKPCARRGQYGHFTFLVDGMTNDRVMPDAQRKLPPRWRPPWATAEK